MKKFAYYTLLSYIKNNEWIILYDNVEFNKYRFLDDILTNMGQNGWELVSVSTFIDSEMKSAALIPIRADSVVALTSTTMEYLYFKKEIDCDMTYSKEFKIHLDRISSQKKFTLSFVSYLQESGFEYAPSKINSTTDIALSKVLSEENEVFVELVDDDEIVKCQISKKLKGKDLFNMIPTIHNKTEHGYKDFINNIQKILL